MRTPKLSQLLRIPLLVLTFATCCTAHADTADSVYTSGRFYTVNETQPWAESVAIKNGRFVFVGNEQEAQAFIGAATEVVDLRGAMPIRICCGLVYI